MSSSASGSSLRQSPIRASSASGISRRQSSSAALPTSASAQRRRASARGRRGNAKKAESSVVFEEVRALMEGESEGFITAALRTLKQDPRWNQRAAPPRELLLEAQEKVKLEWYSTAFEACAPSCLLTFPSFIGEVLKRVMRKYSTSELLQLLSGHKVDLYFMWHEALRTTMQESDKLSCPICMDPFILVPEEDGVIDVDNITGTALSEWKPTLRTNEHWSSNPCGHVTCLSCMKAWAETGIEEQKSRIKCPAVGCSHVLWEHDLKALVTEEAFGRYKTLQQTDHLQKMKDDLKDPALSKWLKSNARPCPDCHIIVSRSEGCNVMTCVCGTRFCYACGFKECSCRKPDSSRSNIWNPN